MKVKPEGQLLLVDPKDLSVALKTANTMIIRVVIYAKRISLTHETL